jgi:hypothetical protein
MTIAGCTHNPKGAAVADTPITGPRGAEQAADGWRVPPRM